jgi:hypothetical protein
MAGLFITFVLQYYMFLLALGVPFFATMALLERAGNPLLTRNSTPEEISDRCQACAIACASCFLAAAGIGAYLHFGQKPQHEEN